MQTNYLLPFVTLSQSAIPKTQRNPMDDCHHQPPVIGQQVWNREQQTCPTLMKARVTSSTLAKTHLKKSLLAAHKSEFFMKHT